MLRPRDVRAPRQVAVIGLAQGLRAVPDGDDAPQFAQLRSVKTIPVPVPQHGVDNAHIGAVRVVFRIFHPDEIQPLGEFVEGVAGDPSAVVHLSEQLHQVVHLLQRGVSAHVGRPQIGRIADEPLRVEIVHHHRENRDVLRHDVASDHRRGVQRRVADRSEQADRHQAFGEIGFRTAHHHLGRRDVVDHPRTRIVRIAHLVDQPVLFLPLEAVAAQARGAVIGQQVVGRIGIGEPRPLDAPRTLHLGHAVVLEQVGVGLSRHRGDHVEARPVVRTIGAQHHPALGSGLAHL